MPNYEIVSVAVQASIESTNEEPRVAFDEKISTIVYTRDGSDAFSLDLPEATLENFIPIEEVTNDILIAWIEQNEVS